MKYRAPAWLRLQRTGLINGPNGPQLKATTASEEYVIAGNVGHYPAFISSRLRAYLINCDNCFIARFVASGVCKHLIKLSVGLCVCV